MEDNLAEKLLPDLEAPAAASRAGGEENTAAATSSLFWNTTTTTDHQARDSNKDTTTSGTRTIQVNQQPHHHSTTTTTTTVFGEKQPDGYRDVFCAVLFVGHWIILLYLAFRYGFGHLHTTYQSYGTATETVRFTGILWMAVRSSVLAVSMTATALYILLHTAQWLIPAGLVCSLLLNFVVVVIGATQHAGWTILIFSTALLVWTVWYASAAWRRMAYSVANLTTALQAVQTNGGIMLVAVGMSILLVVLTILWMVAWLGVYVRHATCETDGHCRSHVNGMVILLFVLSYFWTAQVCKNIVHVTVSGVVGTFLLTHDEADRFWSSAITDSLIRSSTWSFGSICLGSLLTALFQVVHTACRQLQTTCRRQNAMLLLCIMECMTGFLERLVTYFNKWAYCYVGLYGYDYLQAGLKVGELFRERGWTAVIADDLIQRTLSLVSLGIGLGTGAMGLLLTSKENGWLDAFNDSNVAAFWLPTAVGLALSYLLLMSVVGAAVDTVIVVFAEAPLELERNHPGLYRQMVSAWRQIYPDEFHL